MGGKPKIYLWFAREKSCAKRSGKKQAACDKRQTEGILKEKWLCQTQ